MYIAQIDDAVIATLAAAVIALAGSLVVTILNATVLESRRQTTKRDTQRDMLKEALYTEIVWKLREICRSCKEFGALKRADDLKTLEEALSSFETFPVYDSALKTPDLFYQINDAREIEYFYQTIREIRGSAKVFVQLTKVFLEQPDRITEEQIEKVYGTDSEFGRKLVEYQRRVFEYRRKLLRDLHTQQMAGAAPDELDTESFKKQWEEAVKEAERGLTKIFKRRTLKDILNTSVSRLDKNTLDRLKDETAEGDTTVSKIEFPIIDELCFQNAT